MASSDSAASGGRIFLASAISRFHSLKDLTEKAVAQASDDDLFWSPDSESNSIAILVQHMAGNMVSRWTDFLSTDGEKPSRNRDGEFEAAASTRAELMDRWRRGWQCLFSAIEPLSDEDLCRTVTIRGEALSVIDAIHRQIAHYAQHAGQVIYIVKMRRQAEFESLSIPRKR